MTDSRRRRRPAVWHKSAAVRNVNRCMIENSQHDELDDEFDDGDSDEWDFDDDEVSEVLPCPNCGAEVYEDALRCPVCGDYITFRASVWSGRNWWWIILGILGIAAVVLALSGLAGFDLG